MLAMPHHNNSDKDLSLILDQFDREARSQPVCRAGLSVLKIGKVLCQSDLFNFVTYWEFSEDEAVSAVEQVLTHFRGKDVELMWRIYAHDQPANLPSTLAAAGFIASEPGTLMLAGSSIVIPEPRLPDLKIRRVSDAGMVDDFLRTENAAFGIDEEPKNRHLYLADLNNPRHLLYVAYLDDIAVASARMEISLNFAQLYGGGVIAAYRHQGIYKALLATRAQVARQMGARYLITEAADTSQPILARLGFIAAGSETTWVYCSHGKR